MSTLRAFTLAAVVVLPGFATAGDLLDYPGPGYRNQPEGVLSLQEKTVAPGSKSLFKLPPSQRIDLLQPGKVSLTLDPKAPAAPVQPPKKVE